MRRLRFLLLVLATSGAGAGGAAAGERLGPDWVQMTDNAGWQARDSQGELVFNDRLWIMGGWFQSYEAPPRDVWSTADGKSWTQVTPAAPFKASDLGMTLTFRDRMWFLGGWYNGRLPGHAASNEVWSSADGKDWTLAASPADGRRWSPRLAAGTVVFQDKMWMLGGTENYYFGDDSSLKNDVWHSADGATWTQATPAAGWSPRAYHQAVVHAGKIWVLGGGNYVPTYHAKNDVWCSADGIHWELVTSAAPWSPRLWFSAVAYRDHLWVLGGWHDQPSTNLGDVWYSRDGKEWTALKAKRIWKERHEHSALVHRDKIWIIGGHARPLTNDVWSLELPPDFFPSQPQ